MDTPRQNQINPGCFFLVKLSDLLTHAERVMSFVFIVILGHFVGSKETAVNWLFANQITYLGFLQRHEIKLKLYQGDNSRLSRSTLAVTLHLTVSL